MNNPQNLPIQSDIIIDVIDFGIWPESESFNDRELRARYYIMKSARDDTGHGSHTASTAAGRPVNASFYGIVECRQDHCEALNILSAFDDAIRDGVDMISVSLAEDVAHNLPNDVIAIGALHGILVVQAAGSDGDKASIGSVAPWIFSVAASSTDRAIITKVTLGDETTKSVNSFSLHGTSLPIIYGDETRCHKEVASVGGLEVIAYVSSSDVSYVVPTAASSLNGDDFNSIQSYYNST
ncbi:hypothetical protein MIMGU_mgv1a021372mg, partial [Erythranthe guttata]